MSSLTLMVFYKIRTLHKLSEPHNFGKSAADYMQQLKKRLETAKVYASEQAVNKQAEFVARINTRLHDKSFKAGDQIIVLVLDSDNKLHAKWTPGVVKQKVSAYSYVVQFEDIRQICAR